MILLINSISFLFLVYIILNQLKSKCDSSIFWFSIFSLYFVGFPLLIDSYFVFTDNTTYWNDILLQNNLFWNNSFLDQNILNISYYYLAFNFVLIGTYKSFDSVFKINFRTDEINDKDSYLSWKKYIIFSWLSLILYIVLFLSGKGNSSFIGRLSIVVYTFLFVSSMSVVLKMLVTKKYILGIIVLIPCLIISYHTLARANMIAAAVCVLYFFIFKRGKIKTKNIVLIILLGVFISGLLRFIRIGEWVTYPISRDWSYSDLYYVFSWSNDLYNQGKGTINLILTGTPFFDHSQRDLTSFLADFKFQDNWGTLHPTVYGWSYMDNKYGGLFLAAYFGLICFLIDYFRWKTPIWMNILIIPFILRFLTIMVRGSVQYAYSNTIYSIIIFIIIFYIYKKSKR